MAALGASTHHWFCCRKNTTLRRILSNLRPCVNNTTDETNENGRYASECNRSREEDETTDSDWQFVEGTNHGVSCRRGNTDTPSRTVRDEDGSKTRVDHAENKTVSSLKREVLKEVFG